MAYEDALQKLRSKNPTINADRWEEAKRDAADFVKLWGDEAFALGWPEEELFGLHAEAPFSRVDVMGLV